MAEQRLEQDELKLEKFSQEHFESVSELILKFLVHPKEEGSIADELGLVEA